MILKCKLYTLSLLTFLTIGCGNYSFTGASIPEGTESFQVNLFENNSGNNVGSIFEPGLEEILKRNLKQKRLIFTSDLKKAVISSDIIFIHTIIYSVFTFLF